MDLVDEQNRIIMLFQFCNDRLQAFLEIAAITRTSQQCAHVEREDGGALEDFGNVSIMDALGESFGDGGLADTGVADVERVVLGAAAQHLDGPLDFRFTPYKRVDFSVCGFLVEVDTIGFERFASALVAFLVFGSLLVGTAYRPVLGPARYLGNAMANVVHRIEPRHVLFLQVIDRVAFALGEHRYQHVGTGDFLAARRLHVNGGTLNDALETCSGFRIVMTVHDKVRQFLIKVVF